MRDSLINQNKRKDNYVRTTEDWASVLYNLGDMQGGIDSEQDLIPTVRDIQFDAMRKPLLELTQLKLKVIEYERILKKIEEECDNADGTIDATPCEKQANRILGIIKG